MLGKLGRLSNASWISITFIRFSAVPEAFGNKILPWLKRTQAVRLVLVYLRLCTVPRATQTRTNTQVLNLVKPGTCPRIFRKLVETDGGRPNLINGICNPAVPGPT